MAFIWKHPNSQYWQARFTDREGHRRNRSTKVRIKGASQAETRENRKTARRLADEYETASRTRRTVLQARRVIADLTEELIGQTLSERSLREHVASWQKRKKGSVSVETYKFYRGATDRFVKFMEGLDLADEDLGCVTSDHIRRFRDKRNEEVLPKTVNHDLKCLRTLFRDAKKEHLIADNPTEFVETVRNDAKKVRRPFTVAEIQDVLRVADKEWRSMVIFGVYTGQRLADIALLTWNNLDLELNEVRLTTRKTGKLLRIPMAPPLLDLINDLPISDNPDQPLHPRAYDKIQRHGKSGNLSNDFANLLFKAGLREEKVSHHKKPKEEDVPKKGGKRATHRAYALSFHSLRHTAVTLLHDAGVPMSVAQTLIGHDSQSMHQHYIGVGRESLVRAADKLPDLLTTNEQS